MSEEGLNVESDRVGHYCYECGLDWQSNGCYSDPICNLANTHDMWYFVLCPRCDPKGQDAKYKMVDIHTTGQRWTYNDEFGSWVKQARKKHGIVDKDIR